MDYIIETNSLTKKYKEKNAVSDVSIHVEHGDIYGLIGKNGAGKTTLMKIILGLTTPSSGEITLFGSKDLNKERARIGSLIEAPALYKNESALENMKRMALLVPATDEKINELLELVGLSDTGKKKAGAFSLGMKQRLGIAMALLGDPELLILDEPINGLDPAGIKEVRDLIVKLNKKGITILISSHLLDELGKIATRYGIVNNGALEEFSAKELKEKSSTSLTIIVDDIEKTKNILTEFNSEIQFETMKNGIRILSHIDDTSALNKNLVEANIKVYELKYESVGFEDFFIQRLGD